MTYDEFLVAYYELKGFRTIVGAIRCDKGDCPVVAVAHSRPDCPRLYTNIEVSEAAWFLKMENSVLKSIVKSADYWPGHQDNSIRMDLENHPDLKATS